MAKKKIEEKIDRNEIITVIGYDGKPFSFKNKRGLRKDQIPKKLSKIGQFILSGQSMGKILDYKAVMK